MTGSAPISHYPPGGQAREQHDAVNVAAAAGLQPPRMPGPRGAAVPHPAAPGRTWPQRGNNVETPHPAEKKHAYIVFYFHRMQSFHDKGRPGPDRRADARRTALKDTTPPLS